MEAVGFRVRHKARILLDNIRFEHTIFALPFAYLGMLLAAGGLPTLHQLIWITVAMAAARTLAMSVNRLVDREQDARNPRTAKRPLPRGLISSGEVLLVCALSLVVLSFAAWQLNPLCVLLFPVAVAFLIGYSYTKRFTWLSHFILGITDGGAPVGGWIAVTGVLAWEPIILGVAVALWIAGFDLIYACQDVEFDRANGLHSVPVRFSIATALHLSTLCHVLTVLLLLWAGLLLALGWPYWLALLTASALLLYEHRLVAPTDLSRLDIAFFNVNGYVALIVFAGAALGLWVR